MEQLRVFFIVYCSLMHTNNGTTEEESAQDQIYLLTSNLKFLQLLREEKARASIRLAWDSFPSTTHGEKFVNRTHFKSLKLSDELTRARYEMKDLQSEQTASLFIPQALHWKWKRFWKTVK